MSDVSSPDSNSDSGLDVKCVDSESCDDSARDEPLGVFKNPNFNLHKHVIDKALVQVLKAHQSSEPVTKRARLSSVKGPATERFGSKELLGANYADVLLEEANLGNPIREVHKLPELQTVLKSILRSGICNANRNPPTSQVKIDKPTKRPTQSLQTSNDANKNAQNNLSVSSVGCGVSVAGRRAPLGGRQLTLCTNFPSRSKRGQVELRIISQPEQQHRARYMTEGSRGAVKDRIGSGYPTIKLFGYYKPVTLQVFIGADHGKVQPHLFYQASKVCGKNSAPCNQNKIDGTVVLELSLQPEKDMTLSCDCIGILKERNVDVDQRLLHFSGTKNKKRSTRCRLVFRVTITNEDGTLETLQVASAPIVCTQPQGVPEISRKSLCECPASGNVELFVIGKNFLKDTEIVFEECPKDNSEDSSLSSSADTWRKVVLPEKDFLQPNHLICTVPPYHDTQIRRPVRVRLLVQSSGKSSEPQNFTYLPVSNVAYPVPGPSIVSTCVTDTGLGLVQQKSQTMPDLGPTTVIQLPLICQQQQQQLPQKEMTMSDKQQKSTKQQVLITALLIPSSSSKGNLLQPAPSNSSPSAPVVEPPIQVLVMSPSTTVSVPTSSLPASNTTSVVNCVLNKNLTPSLPPANIFCSPQIPPCPTQKKVPLSGLNNSDPILSSAQLDQLAMLQSLNNATCPVLPKDVQTIHDLLLQNTSKQICTDTNLGNKMIVEEVGKEVEFNNSLQQSKLNTSLENISLQPFILNTPSDIATKVQEKSLPVMQDNCLESVYITGSEVPTNFVSTEAKELPMEVDLPIQQNKTNKESKMSDIAVSTPLTVDSILLNSVVANSLISSNLSQASDSQLIAADVRDLSSNTATNGFDQCVDSYFLKKDNLVETSTSICFDHINNTNPVQTNMYTSHDLAAVASCKTSTENVPISLASENKLVANDVGNVSSNTAKTDFDQCLDSYFQKEDNLAETPTSICFDHVSISNPLQTNMYTNRDFTAVASCETSAEKVPISLTSENNFQMSNIDISKQGLAEAILESESRLANATERFTMTHPTSGILNAKSVSDLPTGNFQNDLQVSLTNADCFSFSLKDTLSAKQLENIMIAVSESAPSKEQDSITSKINFEQNLLGQTSENAQNDSIVNDVQFQKINEEVAKTSPFVDAMSIGIDCNLMQSITSSTNEALQVNSGASSTSIQNLEKDVLNSVVIANASNLSNLLCGISENVSNKVSVQENIFNSVDSIVNTTGKVLNTSRESGINASIMTTQQSLLNSGSNIRTTQEENTSILFETSNETSKQLLQMPFPLENGIPLSKLEDEVIKFVINSQDANLNSETNSLGICDGKLGTMSDMPVSTTTFTESSPATTVNTLSEIPSSILLLPVDNLKQVNQITGVSDNPHDTKSNFTPMDIQSEKLIQQMLANENIEFSDVSFTTTTHSISIPSESAVHETYVHQSLLPNSNTHQASSPFVTSHQDTCTMQTLTTTTVNTSNENSSTITSQIASSGLPQQSFNKATLLMNVSQHNATTLTSVPSEVSRLSNPSASESSFNQISTLISLLPDNEILKIINSA